MESQSHCKSLSSDLAQTSDGSQSNTVSESLFKDCGGYCWVKGHMSSSQGWQCTQGVASLFCAASQHRAPGGPTY